MAKFFYDFAVGDGTPTISRMGDGGGSTSFVSGGSSGRVWHFDLPTSGSLAYRAFYINDVGTFEDGEILLRCRYSFASRWGTLEMQIGGFGRVKSVPSYTDAYVGGQVRGDQARINRSTSSTSNQNIGSASHSEPADQAWFWIRFRVEGDQQFLKVWLDSESEPGSWVVTSTNSSNTGSGQWGWGTWRSSGFPTWIEVDLVGVATTAEETAPHEPVEEAPEGNFEVADTTTVAWTGEAPPDLPPEGTFAVSAEDSVEFAGTRDSVGETALLDESTVEFAGRRDSTGTFAVDEVTTVEWSSSDHALGEFEVDDSATVEFVGTRTSRGTAEIEDIVTVEWEGRALGIPGEGTKVPVDGALVPRRAVGKFAPAKFDASFLDAELKGRL